MFVKNNNLILTLELKVLNDDILKQNILSEIPKYYSTKVMENFLKRFHLDCIFELNSMLEKGGK